MQYVDQYRLCSDFLTSHFLLGINSWTSALQKCLNDTHGTHKRRRANSSSTQSRHAKFKDIFWYLIWHLIFKIYALRLISILYTKMQDLDTLSLNKAATHPFGTFYLVLFSSLFKCDCSVCEITMHYAVWYRKNFGSPFFYILYFILEAKILMRQISYLYLRLKQFLRPHIYLLCLWYVI